MKWQSAVFYFGDVPVSTGNMQSVKLSVCNALNGKLNINAEDNLAYAA